jgi:hypothetical protein
MLMPKEIKYFQSRESRLTGTNFTELKRKAWAIYHDIDIQRPVIATPTSGRHILSGKKYFFGHIGYTYEKNITASKNSVSHITRRQSIY